MKALHLLHVIKVGGAQSVAYNYATVLKELGIPSQFSGGKKYRDPEYEKFLSQQGEVSYHVSREMVKNSDLIFVHSNQNLLLMFAYRLFPLGWNNKKVIYIQHLNYGLLKFFLLSILINLVCTDFIQITPITTSNVKRFIKIRKHFIVNFQIPKYDRNKWDEIRKKVREELGIGDDKIIVLYSSRFVKGKNVEKFLELASEMREEKDFIFVLLGDGPLVNLVKEYKGDNLKWLGFVADSEKYLIASDIYLFVSLYALEMMPMAMVEAIVCEKTIICYDTEINNFLTDNSTCHIITKEDILNYKKYPNGSHLAKYDFQYALAKFRELINA